MSFLNEERDYNTLTQRVNELYQQGKYDEAIELSKQAINLGRKIWGNLHPDIACNLSNLAYFHYSLGKYREAETLYQEALIISQRLFINDHFYIATTLDNLATVYLAQGKYQEAESFFHKALAIRQRLYLQDHSDIATSLNNLAVLYRSLARYKEAESFFHKALGMLKRLFPQDHPNVAGILNNLAFFYYKQGRYSQAEPLYQEALAMKQRLFSTNHPDLAITLNNLGLVYVHQGKYAQAEHIFKDVLNICKQNFKNEYLIVRVLVNLSNIYFKINNHNAAEPFLQEAFTITENFTEHHPDVALVLNQLAYLYNLQGKYIKSETLYKKCLRIYENLFPLEHPDIAQILNNLACLYDIQKNYSEAEVLNQKALMMYQRLFPQGHPKILDSLINLAYIYINTYRNPLALHFFQEATKVEHRLMSQEFVGSSENDRMHFLERIRNTQYDLLSLVYQYYYPLEASAEKSNAIHIALDVVFKRKALSNVASAAISAAIYSNRYPENIQNSFQQWRSLWQQIVNLQSSLYLPENLPRLEANKNLLNDLHQQVEKLEKDITREVPEIRLENQLVDRETIASELPNNSTLIEFVYFPVYDFVNRELKNPRYVAFILPAKQPNQVQMFDLGEADKIDELISKVREGVTKLKLEDMPISVGNFNPQVTTPENPQRELSLENLLIE
ncbi:tetratricopeptide repeat protein, partial [Anabaena sp. UHCC 0253]|uniref:tetratricopeptide repeat protein n=1 Tax=Anabaena sp. UHCC 0253 TaxID=2590019 RepID=UPI001445D30D